MSESSTLASVEAPEVSRRIDCDSFSDNSPFGLQGLTRETITILNPNCITKLAINLALRSTNAQIRDKKHVEKVLGWHPDWLDEYQIVHLIERSLWIQGHSDLVMTMLKNPSQIPDNPPEKILQALSRAYSKHPDATIWYGVPLFGDQTNEEGLPIPVTASEVRAEADRRIEAAQKHALRWGWLYRAALTTARIPSMCWSLALGVRNRIYRAGHAVVEQWKRARQDAQARARAIYLAENQRCRFGETNIAIPEHTTWLGQSLETTSVLIEVLARQAQVAVTASGWMGFIGAPIVIAQYAPLFFVPLTVVSVDPFLFVELPEEPGKLRHIGHWYWQKQSRGRQKLHVHA